MSALAGAIESGTALVLLLFGARWLTHGVLRLVAALPVPLDVWPTFMILSFVAPTAVLLVTTIALGQREMAVGALIGVQMLLLLLGNSLAAVRRPVARSSEGADWRDSLALGGATVVFVLFALDGQLVRWEGLVLLLAAAAYLLLIATPYRRTGTRAVLRSSLPGALVWSAFCRPVAGFVMLGLGAVLMVEGASIIGPASGIPNPAIGALLLAPAIGLTTLQSLLPPAHKRAPIEATVMLSYLVATLTMNAGIVALFASANVPARLQSFDVWLLVATTVVVLLVLLGSKPLSRIEACGLTGLYVAYLATLFEPVYSSLR